MGIHWESGEKSFFCVCVYVFFFKAENVRNEKKRSEMIANWTTWKILAKIMTFFNNVHSASTEKGNTSVALLELFHIH